MARLATQLLQLTVIGHFYNFRFLLLHVTSGEILVQVIIIQALIHLVLHLHLLSFCYLSIDEAISLAASGDCRGVISALIECIRLLMYLCN